MKFLNDEHRNFYYLVVKLIKIRTNFKKITTCEKSFIYLLGLCDVTREHINEIFSLNKGFNIEALEYEWQTETSLKVTKLAFNLLAEWSYDTEQDALQNKVSSSYSVNEIFDCELVPYFIEAIKMRFPQYFKENKIEIQENNDNRFTSWKIEKFEDLTDSNIVGLYVRTCNKGEEAEELVCKQVELLEEYCKDNSIANTILYVDTGASGKTS